MAKRSSSSAKKTTPPKKGGTSARGHAKKRGKEETGWDVVALDPDRPLSAEEIWDWMGVDPADAEEIVSSARRKSPAELLELLVAQIGADRQETLEKIRGLAESEPEGEDATEEDRRQYHRRYSDRRIAQALVACYGYVYEAAAALGCSARWIYKRLEASPILAELRSDLEEGNLDAAEVQLQGRIRAGDLQAIKFYLDRKGRRRGYGEKVQVDQKTEITVELPEAFRRPPEEGDFPELQLDGDDPGAAAIAGDQDATEE